MTMKKLLPIILGLLATACASSQPAPQQTLSVKADIAKSNTKKSFFIYLYVRMCT